MGIIPPQGLALGMIDLGILDNRYAGIIIILKEESAYHRTIDMSDIPTR